MLEKNETRTSSFKNVSLQLTNTDTSSFHDAVAWVRQNGVDIPDSGNYTGVPAQHAGNPGGTILTFPLLINAAANDYIQVYWTADNTAINITTFPAGTTPVYPVIPVSPVIPVGPVYPVDPVRPVGPVTPIVPVYPYT